MALAPFSQNSAAWGVSDSGHAHPGQSKPPGLLAAASRRAARVGPISASGDPGGGQHPRRARGHILRPAPRLRHGAQGSPRDDSCDALGCRDTATPVCGGRAPSGCIQAQTRAVAAASVRAAPSHPSPPKDPDATNQSFADHPHAGLGSPRRRRTGPGLGGLPEAADHPGPVLGRGPGARPERLPREPAATQRLERPGDRSPEHSSVTGDPRRRSRVPGHAREEPRGDQPQQHRGLGRRPHRGQSAGVGAVPRRAHHRGDEPDRPGPQRGREPRVRRGRRGAAPDAGRRLPPRRRLPGRRPVRRRRLRLPGRQRGAELDRSNPVRALLDPELHRAPAWRSSA